MTGFEAIAIAAAGLAAGAINTIVGSGSLITFPTLLAFGYPPLVANVSNTVGLVPGAISGAVGYRRELSGQRSRMIRLGTAGVLGGLTGGILLLAIPASVFGTVVPFLILFACGLMALQPRLTRYMVGRGHARADHPLPLTIGVYLTGIYGGYFGAAQGVILITLLAIFLTDDLQRLNGLKNVISALVNGVAAILFLAIAPVDITVALLLAIGSIAGGQLGAYVGRRLPAPILRGVIVSVGTVVAIWLLIR